MTKLDKIEIIKSIFLDDQRGMINSIYMLVDEINELRAQNAKLRAEQLALIDEVMLSSKETV